MSITRSRFFKSQKSNAQRLACLVTGFTGKISQYEKAIQALLAAGYDVIAFEYDNTVLDIGDPRLLLDVVTEVVDGVKDYIPKYDMIISTGVSLGAYVAINVQRKLPKVRLGVYGTAGMPVSQAVFHSPVFRKVKKAFVANGFTEKSLRAAWGMTDETKHAGIGAGQSIFVVLGKQDRILPYKVAVEVLEGWRRQGVKVDYFALPTRGHSMTIRWYKNNLGQLLERAKAL